MTRITRLAASAARQRKLDPATLDERADTLTIGDIVALHDASHTVIATPRIAPDASGAVASAALRQRGTPLDAIVHGEPIATDAPQSEVLALEDSAFPPYERIALSPTRRTIAERLSASKSQAPHFYMSIDVSMHALLAMRADLNALLAPDVKLSVNDVFLKLVANTLSRHRSLNAAWIGDAVACFHQVNLAVAVAVDGGLLTPVIRDAANKGLRAIARETHELIAAARERRLAKEAFAGGTFTISNLGMYGVRDFAAIINPPQAAILAIAGVRRELVPDDRDRPVTAERTTLTLSVDHRVADGVSGAEFLNALKTNVEEPRRLLL